MDTMQSMELIAPGIWRLRFGTPEAITPVSVRQSTIRDKSLAELPVICAPPFTLDQAKFRTSARGCEVILPLGSEEGLYGLGLQLKSHLQSGKKKTMRVNSDPVADTGDSHAPVPFYVSTAGYGILVDTCRYASFYCGTHNSISKIDAQLHDVEQRKIAESTEELYQLHGLSDRVVVDIPVARGVDVYLFAGPSLGEAVQRYNLFSGGGCLPPLWGLGGWYRCFGNSTTVDVMALAEQLRQTHLPMDVIGLEPGWQSHTYPCSFTWAQERFPDSDAMLATLRDKGYRVNLWEHVFVHPSAPFAAAIRPYCGDEMAFNGLVPDFLTPEAQQIFRQHHKEVLVERGIAGFKLDECDNSDFIQAPWSFPEWTQFPSGADGEVMHSLLGIRYQETINAIYRQSGKRHYSQVRSSHALAASLPYTLYSDLYDYRDFLRGLVNAGFSGLLWCPEVRDAVSVQDLVRRMQLAVLSPHANINAWYLKNTPWEAMDESGEAVALVRQALELRMRLLPYFYAAFARYWKDGQPPFRALVMDYPADMAVRQIDDQFLIGDALLAAPVAPGATERIVYLPPGNWYDFATGQRYSGGAQYTVATPLEYIPLFVRGGAVLPLATPVQHIDKDTVLEITPTVYGNEPAVGILFEDDGETYAYETGKAAWIELRWSQANGKQITRSATLPFQRYEFMPWKFIN